MNAHTQAGTVAFVGGLAVIEAETLAMAVLIVGVAAMVAVVILLTHRRQT